MLPHVQAEHGQPLGAVDVRLERVVLVGRRRDDQLPVRARHEPGPARAKDAGGSRVELGLQGVGGPKRGVDRGLEAVRRAIGRRGGRHVGPEQRVVQVAAAVVAGGEEGGEWRRGRSLDVCPAPTARPPPPPHHASHAPNHFLDVGRQRPRPHFLVQVEQGEGRQLRVLLQGRVDVGHVRRVVLGVVDLGERGGGVVPASARGHGWGGQRGRRPAPRPAPPDARPPPSGCQYPVPLWARAGTRPGPTRAPAAREGAEWKPALTFIVVPSMYGSSAA